MISLFADLRRSIVRWSTAYNVGSILSFLGALVVYWLCVEPSASFWDCPEYIVTAACLEPGHPPGNPAWSLTANLFASAARILSDADHIALAVNLSSGIFTALAVMMLFQIIFIAMRWLWPYDSNEVQISQSKHSSDAVVQSKCKSDTAVQSKCKSGTAAHGRLIPCVAALAGALCFAWADSTLFSAVEAEVYAMSILFTALFVRVAVAWAECRRSGKYGKASRLLILLGYLTGVSIGVHELNLLAIPCCAMIGCFALRPVKACGAAWLTILLSFGVVGAILLGLMPGVIYMAGEAELFAVNTLHLSRHSGEIAFILLLIAALIAIPLLLERYRRYTWADAMWTLAFIVVGFSVYIVIPIRSSANTPMNQGAPSDAFSLLSYIKRDQYGTKPLFYGNTPYSETMRIERINPDGTASYDQSARKRKRPLYAPAVAGAAIPASGLLTPQDTAANAEALRRAARGEEAYVITGYTTTPVMTPELNMVFPRMTSRNPAEIRGYGDWTGMDTTNMVRVEVSYALDSVGRPVQRLRPDGTREHRTALRPTYLQQLQYMLGYQFGYMYFRYLGWNFIGRQNDLPAAGEIDHGMPITGIDAIDEAIMCSDSLPDELWRDNRGRNSYLLLPLLFGLGGVVYLCCAGRRGRRMAACSTILFLLTGVAIVFYLNQGLGEARERDYSFMGSFFAFTFWIGIGMGGLMRGAAILGGRLKERGASSAVAHLPATAAMLLAVATPAVMLAENYDDHDRSHRTFVDAYARNLLESVAPNAVIFVEGDNVTFPLWYAQEVLGVRRDVKVVNLSYLLTPWYVQQLPIPSYEAAGVKMTLTPDVYGYGAMERVQLAHASVDSLYIPDAREALAAVAAQVRAGKTPRFPSHKVRIYNPDGDSIHINLRTVGGGAQGVSLRNVALLDILANSIDAAGIRPVYWHNWISRVTTAPYEENISKSLFFNRFTPGHNGTLQAEALQSVARMESGGMDAGKSYYVDPYLGWGVSLQRNAMLALAQSLADAGSHVEAIEVLRRMERLMPSALWPYQGTVRSGKSVATGLWAADLYIQSGEALHDSAALHRGRALRSSEEARLSQWRRYYDTLPRSRRSAVSPESRRLLPL